MKYIKSLFVSAFMLMACLPLWAQSNEPFAGEDKKILQRDDNSQQVNIGVPDAEEGHCYEWSGPNIIGDNHQPVITVNPRNPINVYHVVKRTSCGKNEDDVTVYLVDSIGIKSVTAKKSCYNDGDSVRLSDFDIETDPPGYSSLVTVSPQFVSNTWGGVVDQQELQFRLSYANNTSTKTATVDVYNEGLSVSTGSSIHLDKVMQGVEMLKNMLQKGKDFVDFLGKGAPASPCEIGFDPVINEPNIHFFRACCEGEEISGYTLSGFSIAPRLTFDCYIPTQFSIPKVGGLNFHVGFSAGIDVGPISYTYKGDCSGLDPVPVSISADVAIGAEVSMASRDVLSIQGDAVATGTASMSWTLGEGVEFDGLKLDLSLVCQVTFFSMYTKKMTVPIGSTVLFKD